MGPAHEFPAGTVLFRQGDRVKALYLVAGGVVKLTRSEDEGRDVIVGLRTTGWLLGSAAAVLRIVHPVTAETLGPAQLRRITAADFVSRLATGPVGPWLNRMQARETYDQVTLLAQFGALSSRQRLEQLLVKLGRAGVEARTGQLLRLKPVLRQDELAQAIGVTREHVARLLTQLEREGLITRQAGWLLISAAGRLGQAILGRESS